MHINLYPEINKPHFCFQKKIMIFIKKKYHILIVHREEIKKMNFSLLKIGFINNPGVSYNILGST